MPAKQLPSDVQEGDYLEVFIYRDSEDRLIATTHRPLAVVGDLAYLKVTAKTHLGAFLDYGLERGLFLPFREQKFSIAVGRSYLVYVYLDKSERISCTTDVYEHLSTNSPYQKNDKANGVVYSVKPEFGAFVAVDNKYKGLIPKNELFNDLRPGDIVQARVIRVREDGKLDLSTRDLSYKQMDTDAEALLTAMRENQGFLPMNEKACPEDIEKMFHLSKASFKRAIGRLLKNNQIIKVENGYKLKTV